MISVRKKAGLTHESTYGSLFVSEKGIQHAQTFCWEGCTDTSTDTVHRKFSDREHCRQYGRDNGIVHIDTRQDIH